jgi:hypothetical protein
LCARRYLDCPTRRRKRASFQRLAAAMGWTIRGVYRDEILLMPTRSRFERSAANSAFRTQHLDPETLTSVAVTTSRKTFGYPETPQASVLH